MYRTVKLCVYQTNLQTQIINSIKSDTTKIHQKNIYSFKVHDIHKRALEESLHHLFFDISSTVIIIFNQFYQGQKLLEFMLLGKEQKPSERASSNDNLENFLQFKIIQGLKIETLKNDNRLKEKQIRR